MSQEERFGTRPQEYSTWHRVRSIARFVGLEAAQRLKMIDQDVTLYLEFDGPSREPLALMEVALDVGQKDKPASTTAKLAARSNLPAFTVLYRLSTNPNPADKRQFDIAGFRVRRIWPAPEHGWRALTPAEWAQGLCQIRSWSAARLQIQAANDPQWEPIQKQWELPLEARG